MIVPSVEIRLIIGSDSLSGSDLVDLFGEADEPVQSVGDEKEFLGQTTVASESTWIVRSAAPSNLPAEAHLDELFERAGPAIDRVADVEAVPVYAVLRIGHYMAASEFQGHGIAIGPEWIRVLARLNGFVDIDQYIVAETQD